MLSAVKKKEKGRARAGLVESVRCCLACDTLRFDS